MVKSILIGRVLQVGGKKNDILSRVISRNNLKVIKRTGWTKRVERRLERLAMIHCSCVGENSVTKLMAPSRQASACPRHSLAKATWLDSKYNRNRIIGHEMAGMVM